MKDPKIKDRDGCQISKYRKIGNSLYRYSGEPNAYICCYTHPFSSKADLIEGYLGCDLDE